MTSGESERADGNDEKRGEEIEWGGDDPRVLFVTNLVLSTVFAAVVAYGLSYTDLVVFPVVNVASVALVLMAATYLVAS